MAYIGKQPVVGNFVKLDSIVTSATATYNLLNGGVAYSPQSANNCIVSLNGIIQEPTSSGNVGGYTISGSTIVFTSALTSLDVIDFILVLGDTLSIGTPSDGTVGFAKVTSNLITGATAETSIAGGDSVLIYDDSASALRKMTRTNFVAGIGATAGQVIQVVQVSKTDTASWSSSATRVDTGLSASITPASASNKILVLWQLNIGYTGSVNQWFIHLDRGGTEINLGDASGSKKRANSTHNVYSATAQDFMAVTTSGMFLDSPATTSSTTYKLQQSGATATGTFYINRSDRDGDYTAYDGRFVSNIILMEVKG